MLSTEQNFSADCKERETLLVSYTEWLMCIDLYNKNKYLSGNLLIDESNNQPKRNGGSNMKNH